VKAIFILALLLSPFFHTVLALFLRKGLSRSYLKKPNNLVPVSVVVAVRNEAAHIKRCLISLDQLDYPAHLLEIFIINDRSTDETHQIISDFIRKKPHFFYLVNQNKNSQLSGKANAVSAAIEKSHGEVIFITDADCEVPKTWIKEMIPYFQNEVGIAAGFTRLAHTNGLLSNLQSLDWACLLTVAAGSIGLGVPLTSLGNNLAIRRQVYQAVGGYQGVGFSVAEDFALLQAVAKITNWKIIAPVCSENIVSSMPVNNLWAFFKQRKRWAIGGRTVHWFGKLLIVTSFFTQTSILLLLLLGNFLIAAAALLITLAGDLILLFPILKKANRLNDLLLLPVYKIFSFFYMAILSIILLINPTVEWKGEKYFR